MGAELFSSVLTKGIGGVALVLAQDIQPILLRLAADAEVIVEGEAQLLFPVLELHEELVVVAAGDLVELVQADEELGGERAEADLVVAPRTVEVLAAVLPVHHNGPAPAPLLLVAEDEEGLNVGARSDTGYSMLLLHAVCRRGRRPTPSDPCPPSAQELRLEAQAVAGKGLDYLRWNNHQSHTTHNREPK